MRRGQAIHMDTDNKDVDVNLDGEIRSMKTQQLKSYRVLFNFYCQENK